MEDQYKKKGQQLRVAILSTIAFAVLSHAAAYRIAESINSAVTGNYWEILTESQLPTSRGLLVMSGIFFTVMLYLMF